MKMVILISIRDNISQMVSNAATVTVIHQ